MKSCGNTLPQPQTWPYSPERLVGRGKLNDNDRIERSQARRFLAFTQRRLQRNQHRVYVNENIAFPSQQIPPLSPQPRIHHITSSQFNSRPSYPSCQLYVLLHDGYSFGMYRTEIGVFKEMHHESLRSLLECQNCLRLPAHLLVTRSTRHRDFSDQSGKWKLSQ